MGLVVWFVQQKQEIICFLYLDFVSLCSCCCCNMRIGAAEWAVWAGQRYVWNPNQFQIKHQTSYLGISFSISLSPFHVVVYIYVVAHALLIFHNRIAVFVSVFPAIVVIVELAVWAQSRPAITSFFHNLVVVFVFLFNFVTGELAPLSEQARYNNFKSSTRHQYLTINCDSEQARENFEINFKW